MRAREILSRQGFLLIADMGLSSRARAMDRNVSPGGGLDGETQTNQRGNPMAEKNLQSLFHDTLRDIYYAERAILKALPKMARGAEAPEVKEAFKTHKDETEVQIERLQQIFEMIGKRAQGKTCPAIDGIIEEGEEVMSEYKGSKALDAALIAAAQAVEHYEITRYGTLKRWAEVLGMDDAVKLLDETLQEESNTDELLTELADTTANEQAVAA